MIREARLRALFPQSGVVAVASVEFRHRWLPDFMPRDTSEIGARRETLWRRAGDAIDHARGVPLGGSDFRKWLKSVLTITVLRFFTTAGIVEAVIRCATVRIRCPR